MNTYNIRIVVQVAPHTKEVKEVQITGTSVEHAKALARLTYGGKVTNCEKAN